MMRGSAQTLMKIIPELRAEKPLGIDGLVTVIMTGHIFMCRQGPHIHAEEEWYRRSRSFCLFAEEAKAFFSV